jgi:hypothetical protein
MLLSNAHCVRKKAGNVDAQGVVLSIAQCLAIALIVQNANHNSDPTSLPKLWPRKFHKKNEFRCMALLSRPRKLQLSLTGPLSHGGLGGLRERLQIHQNRIVFLRDLSFAPKWRQPADHDMMGMKPMVEPFRVENSPGSCHSPRFAISEAKDKSQSNMDDFMINSVFFAFQMITSSRNAVNDNAYVHSDLHY